MMKRAIIIMTKVPGHGNVKTRLHPFLTLDECRELAICLLKDTEKKISQFNVPTIIAFTPVNQKNELNCILQYRHTLIEQRGSELGEKMYHAFEFAFGQGYESVVMIGTDSPTVPESEVSEAFEILGSSKGAVIGKTEDGGFYLIGFHSVRRELFEAVEWGSENAFRQTAANINRAGLSLQYIRTWYDVDKPEDLLRLRADLETNPELAPNTFEWLKNF